MKRYEFYRNQKITVIECRYFSIEAENLETAVQKIKDLCADGQLDELSNASESGYDQQAIRTFMEHTMKTAAGIRLTKTVFGV